MGSRTASIQKRRKLQALFERGAEVRFNASGVNEGDPHPDDIVIFVTPPSPLQREMAIRDAQARKAKALVTAKRSEDDPNGLVSREFVMDMSDSELVEYLVAMNEGERYGEAQRRVLGKKEWDDFDALRDAMRLWEESDNPEDDEWTALLERDRDFGRQVNEEMSELEQADREAFRLMGRKVLEEKAYERRLDIMGSQEFMNAYQVEMLFYACRDGDDHSELFFEDVADLRSADQVVQDALSETLAKFIAEAAEAKNSQGVASGSDSAASPAAPEISESSTPEAAST